MSEDAAYVWVSEGCHVTFTRISSAGSFRAYASVVDQESGDSVYTPGT